MILMYLLLAFEVATLDTTKNQEQLLVMTDETLQSAADKNYLVSTCRPRTNINGTLREYYFPYSCRADVTKFLLNNGYKPDNLYRTFQK